jgi:hypothetical protein
MLSLVNINMLLLNFLLHLLHLLFFLLKLVDQVIQLLLENIVLTLSVKVINTDSGGFVGIFFNFNFLFGDVLIGMLGLLDEVSTRFLNRLLLRSVVDNIISDLLSLTVKLHDRLNDQVLFILNGVLLDFHSVGLVLSGV